MPGPRSLRRRVCMPGPSFLWRGLGVPSCRSLPGGGYALSEDPSWGVHQGVGGYT